MLRVEGKKWREDEKEGIGALSDWVVLAEVMVKKKNQALIPCYDYEREKEIERCMILNCIDTERESLNIGKPRTNYTSVTEDV